jgi:hypothetical protein
MPLKFARTLAAADETPARLVWARDEHLTGTFA